MRIQVKLSHILSTFFLRLPRSVALVIYHKNTVFISHYQICKSDELITTYCAFEFFFYTENFTIYAVKILKVSQRLRIERIEHIPEWKPLWNGSFILLLKNICQFKCVKLTLEITLKNAVNVFTEGAKGVRFFFYTLNIFKIERILASFIQL